MWLAASEVLNDVVRKYKADLKMINTSWRSEYDYIENALSQFKKNLKSLKINSNLTYDAKIDVLNIHLKDLRNRHSLFTQDREVNALEQYAKIKHAIDKLKHSQDYTEEEISLLATTRRNYEQWMNTHTKILNFSHLYNVYMSEEIELNEETLAVLIIDLIHAIDLALNEVEDIKILMNQERLNTDFRNTKLVNLKKKLGW